MQDTLLQVFVVALSLLTYPRDDPGVEEWDDITILDMQKHEESVLRGGDELDHETAPANEEMRQDGGKGPLDDVRNIHKQQNQLDQYVIEKDQMSVAVIKQDPEEGGVNGKLPDGQKTEDIQTDTSFGESIRAAGQKEKPDEKRAFNSKEQESLLSHFHTKTTENETSEEAITDWETDCLWYMWNILSIISMIRLLRKYLGRSSQMKREEARPFPVTCTAAEVPLPDSDTLQQFHSKSIKASSDKKWREEEFLEGFANDLLDTMRNVCGRNSNMVIEGFQMVDASNITVPFKPSDPYSFQCLLLNNQMSDLLPDMQVCGQIKLVEDKKVEHGCHCQSPDADDMVCLLHCETEKAKMKVTDVCDSFLCTKNSEFLSKSQVTRWFQSTIKQAWALISHKYEFELNIRYIDAPGALVVRFRSGKRISFSMNPVVKFNSEAHFFITPCSQNNLDTFWTLSLTNYEDRFLEHVSKHLPQNSCHRQTLKIAHFLHRRQTVLSGSSAIKDFHYKNALMHLLLTTSHSQWKPNCVAHRLRDLLKFIEKRLERKVMHHVLIGNPLAQKVIDLPAEFTRANTVNLFHPLVVHNCIYRNAVMQFQEMLRNAHMLIHDYVDQRLDSDNCFI